MPLDEILDSNGKPIQILHWLDGILSGSRIVPDFVSRQDLEQNGSEQSLLTSTKESTMSFGDQLTEEELQRLLQKSYNGFLGAGGPIGQIPQTPQMPVGQFEVPVGAAPAPQPVQPESPSIIDRVKGLFQPSQAQAQSQVQSKPQSAGMPDFMGLLAEQEKNQKGKWALPIGLGLLNLSAQLATPYRPGIDAPPLARGIQGLSQGMVQGMALQKAQQDEVYKKIKAVAELKKVYDEPKMKQFTGPDGKIYNAIVDTSGRTTLVDKPGTPDKGHWATVMGPNGPVVKLLKPGEEGEAYEKPEKLATLERDVQDEMERTGKSHTEAHAAVTGRLESAKVAATGGRWKPERYVTEEGKSGVWVKPGDPVPEGHIPESQYIAKSSELNLDPAAIDAMAERYMIDGTMPGLGLGKAATKARSMVMNKVAEKMGQTGQTPQDLKTNQIVTSGLKSEANRLLGQRGPMLAFAETADKNLDVALNLSGKVDRTGTPVVNRWLLAGRKSLAGDPDVAAFHAATQVAINEFAKVTSSATGGGVTSDTARKEIEELLNTAQTPQQFKAVADTLRLDMKNRVVGYESSLQRLQDASRKIGVVEGKDKSGDTKPKYTPEQLKIYRDKYTESVNRMNALPPGPEKEAWAKKLADPKLKAEYRIK